MSRKQTIPRTILIASLLFAQTVDTGVGASLSQPNRTIPSTPLLALPVGLVVANPPYSLMPEKAQREFIKRAFVEVAAKLSALPVELPDEAVPLIKHWVDAYARRIGTKETKLWQEDLRLLFRRAVQFTPTIIQAYREQHVPSLLGVYVPMTETEYRNIASNNVARAAGLFQFTSSAAKTYGLAPKDRTDVEKMANASARYAYDRLREFDQDVTGVCLAIASFNRSSSAIRREFQPIINSKLRDRDFWLLLKSKAAGDPQFKAENLRYVPRFFAAAIIGENPRSFKLPMLPLSSYSEVPAIKPIPPDQLEKAAVKVIRDISNDESYSFSPQVLQELASEVEFQRYHATGLRTMRNEFRNMDQTKLLEEAQKQGIKPNLLVYATIADEVFGSSRIYSADYVLRHLVQLQAHFGSQFADAILLTLAAYKIPGEDNRSHPLLADLRRLVQNPQTDRNIWFLHEQGAISLEAYDFVLRFLAIGIIAQEMNS